MMPLSGPKAALGLLWLSSIGLLPMGCRSESKERPRPAEKVAVRPSDSSPTAVQTSTPAVAARVGTPTQLVEAAWRGLGRRPGPGDCRWYDDLDHHGPLAAFCAVAGTVSYTALQSALPFPIFVNGPHDRTELKRDQAQTFGRYNPKFVEWLNRVAGPVSTRPEVVKAARPVYSKKLREGTRMFLAAKRFLDAEPALKAKLLEDYRGYMAKPEGLPPFVEYWELFPEFARYEPQAIGGVALAWWLRRDLDGTADGFEKALRRLVAAYDPAFLRALDELTPKTFRTGLVQLIDADLPALPDKRLY